ncbi:hypothetical protein LZ30DRAFT_712186 [Colletotrichum cereale]|nr:hypothetical protein LZ30DRAFT_712186 [Colletotrichum cereale]
MRVCEVCVCVCVYVCFVVETLSPILLGLRTGSAIPSLSSFRFQGPPLVWLPYFFCTQRLGTWGKRSGRSTMEGSGIVNCWRG